MGRSAKLVTSQSTEIATRSLDLVAVDNDLGCVLVGASSASGMLLNQGIQIGEWLQHERLNRHERQDYAHGSAGPNRIEEVFRTEVEQKPAIKPILPLFFQYLGSLGCLLVFDEDLCWMVSNIGCLLNCLIRFVPASYTLEQVR